MDKLIRTIIVEDEARGRNALEKLLARIPSVELAGSAANVDDAIVLIEDTRPDLVLLDIELPGKNGFDLLQAIPNYNFEVIFTTAYDSYALKAIKFSAVDYLLKPIDPDELAKAIEKAIERKGKRNGNIDLGVKNLLENLKNVNKQNIKLTLPSSDGYSFVPINEIIRCESDTNYTRFYIKGEAKVVVVSRTLKEYDELLSGHGFCRVHHSHLINLRFIKKYVKGEGGYVEMEDGAEVEISRRKRDQFQKAMDTYTSII